MWLQITQPREKVTRALVSFLAVPEWCVWRYCDGRTDDVRVKITKGAHMGQEGLSVGPMIGS